MLLVDQVVYAANFMGEGLYGVTHTPFGFLTSTKDDPHIRFRNVVKKGSFI